MTLLNYAKKNIVKKCSFLILHLLLFLSVFGQQPDSLIANKKINYKSYIAPTVLISGGALLLNSEYNNTIQEKSNTFFGENFHSKADNIFPLVPIVQIYTGKYLGFTPKNNIQQQTINIAFANTATLVVIQALKHSFKKQRPDQSDDLSFPSGHTAIAFTNASLLYYEYKDSNIWYASSGFLFAATTGIFRMANNRHYTSDVLAGAGIGLLSGILTSHWNPFQSIKWGKNKKTTALIYPQIGHQLGLGLVLQPK